VPAHSGSILRKLQWGFALAAVLLAGLMALFMDQALHRSLEIEDAQVMAGQAQALLAALNAGQRPKDIAAQARPEKASWQVRDQAGRVVAQSQDEASQLPLKLPLAGSEITEIEAERGRIYSVLVSPWSGPEGSGTLVLLMDRSHEEALIRGFRQTLLAVVVGAMLAAAVLARAIARWGLAPLAALIAEAGSINDRHLERRLHGENFPLELQELVATLNAGLSRLQEAFERMSRLGSELAHELRTPLQNLRSTLENRARRVSTPVDPGELGALIEDCDRMAALIEQILFLAQSEHAPVLKRILIPIPELLEEIHDFFEAAAEAAGVELLIKAEASFVVSGDRLLLTRALHNLVANALRHTPAGGTVILGAEAHSEGPTLYVEDTGTGIPDGWISRLGTPFVRPPDARNAEGHGLGLAIVKRIATLLGGDMVIVSQAGKGTRVSLRMRAV
jgi:two-component system heavy metal sensor histidine kinase CusS